MEGGNKKWGAMVQKNFREFIKAGDVGTVHHYNLRNSQFIQGENKLEQITFKLS